MSSNPRLIFQFTLPLLIGVSVCITSLSIQSQARATTLKPLTLGALTRLSTFVFRGRVLSREVIRVSSGAIWTRYRITVLSPWRGALASRDVLNLDLQGGEIKRTREREAEHEGVYHRQTIHAQPELKVHQEGVFFLERTMSGRLVFTGMIQGWFPISLQSGVMWAERDPQLNEHLYRDQSTSQALSHFAGSPIKSLLQLSRIRVSQLKRLVLKGAHPPRAHAGSSVLSVEPIRDVEGGGR